MLYISITLDHEIWMGKNYLPLKEVLLDPTYKLVQALEDVNVRATFFTDVCLPLAFKNNNPSCELSSFICDYEKQLKYLAQCRHDIQLHIHPHWYNASIDKHGCISFNKEFYRLHNYGFSESSERCAYKIISEGINYLNNTIRIENPSYKCIAYRAGGFCVQPEIDLFKALYDNGIRIDSSVAMYGCHKGNDMFYNYKSFEHSSFYVPIDGGFEKKSLFPVKNSLFEVAVGGYRTIGIKNIICRINKQMNGEIRGCGMPLTPLNSSGLMNTYLFKKLHSIFCVPLLMSIDSYDSRSLYIMIKAFAANKDYVNKDVYLSLIGHPKILSRDHFDNIKLLIKKLSIDNNIRFVTMRDIYDILRLS